MPWIGQIDCTFSNPLEIYGTVAENINGFL